MTDAIITFVEGAMDSPWLYLALGLGLSLTVMLSVELIRQLRRRPAPYAP